MNESTILLSPAPGAKGDFLTTVCPLESSASDEDTLPFEITLGGYSRDKWAMDTTEDLAKGWKTAFVQSVDGRGKLPGFLKYLKDRKKAAFGKFDTDNGTKAILVVPPDQPEPPSSSSYNKEDVMFCRFILDTSKLRNPEKKTVAPTNHLQHPSQLMIPNPIKPTETIPQKTKPKKKSIKNSNSMKNGFLGNLLGATRKTEAHLAAVPKSSVFKNTKSDSIGDGEFTSGSAIAQFRQDTEQKLLDFKQDLSLTQIKLPVSIAEITKNLDSDQKRNVTMDVLKYIVYEQTEEIGEDKWIAAKEASDYMDEVIISVYKEGCAPAEVLEDLNKGDLPDEIRGQQRAMREASMKLQAKKEEKKDLLRQQQTMKSATSGITELNTNKRDRRTIAEIQRDMMKTGESSDDVDPESKKARTS